MITQDKGTKLFILECDEVCDNRIEINNNGEWKGIVAVIKEKGWRIAKKADMWVHYCPSCVMNWRKRQA